jgi:hypothetical protein
MKCLNERIVGVVFFVLSGHALAGGLFVNALEDMTVASIELMPLEVTPHIPEALGYLQRYEMEFQATQGSSFYGQIGVFYSAQVIHEFRFGTGKAIQMAEPALPQASILLHPEQSTAPQISLIEVPDPTFTVRAQPQRRLSLTVDNWVFSGTARVAALGSRNTGATLTVRHGF